MPREQPIPTPWLDSVCKILRSNDLKNIDWTQEAINQWQLQTYGAWLGECHEAMEKALKRSGVMGLKVELRERGESYAFWYGFNGEIFYGKICLRAGNVRIKLVSAHLPEKGTAQL